MEPFFNTCKPGEILGNNGQCAFPERLPIAHGEPVCTGGRIIEGQCYLPAPPVPLNCTVVQISIAPECLNIYGCTPDPAVGIALMFTLLVHCF